MLNNFNAQGVANTIWACAKSGFVHLKLMNALAERAMHPEVLPLSLYPIGREICVCLYA